MFMVLWLLMDIENTTNLKKIKVEDMIIGSTKSCTCTFKVCDARKYKV